MQNDKESVRRLIRETVCLVCQGSLSHVAGVRIQGLIGITVDDNEVFLVQFDESYNHSDGEEHSKQQNNDSTSATVAEPFKQNPPKRRRLSETATSATTCDTPAKQSAAAAEEEEEEDCDVIFIADEVNDNDMKLEFDEFCSAADNDCNYDQMNNIPAFKSEDILPPTDLKINQNDRAQQNGYMKRGSARNVLLRNMLSEQNNCPSDQAPDVKPELVSYQQTNTQTTSARRQQTTTRPFVKQVLVTF